MAGESLEGKAWARRPTTLKTYVSKYLQEGLADTRVVALFVSKVNVWYMQNINQINQMHFGEVKMELIGQFH